MNRLTITAAVCALSLAAYGEGYQVNTFSARQQGMGHTGVSQILGAESVIFNPAAVASMHGNVEISGSLSAISPTAYCEYQGVEYKSSNKVSTPLNISAAFRINERMAAGVTLYTPYGSSINWGLNWPLAVLNQSVDLKVFAVQPTFSWRITPKLSVGAGLSIAWGSVDLSKGLVAAGSLDRLLGLMGQAQGVKYPEFGNVSPASANLVGSSKLAYGFNLGALYEINDKFTVGASFRSKLDMHVESGDVKVIYANEIASQVLEKELNNLNYTNFDASMPCPYVLTAGVSYRPTDRVLLAFDAQLNGWGTYKDLNISFAEQPQFNQHLVKDYHNAMTYHLGVEVKATERLDARAGLMVDTSPCNTDHYNPETPGATKIEPSVGLTFKPANGLAINLAFMYVYGTTIKDAAGQYDDFIAPKYNALIKQYGLPLQELPVTGEFKADYHVRAIIPAIGVSYTF